MVEVQGHLTADLVKRVEKEEGEATTSTVTLFDHTGQGRQKLARQKINNSKRIPF
ncbi:MAG: hypothetical protein M0Q51_06485 [Bacteroidales bacterium]|nr:hypothetical protein [Bacteroidales bacterium]